MAGNRGLGEEVCNNLKIRKSGQKLVLVPLLSIALSIYMVVAVVNDYKVTGVIIPVLCKKIQSNQIL